MPLSPPQPQASSRRSKRGENPQQRLARVAEAAFECMSRLGFQRTQMADIAQATGLSPAALYTYAQGKEGLLALAFLHAYYRELPPLDLPVAPMPIADLIARSEERVAAVAHWPTLEAAVTAPAPPDLETLEKIGGEAFDLLAKHRNGIWLIDRLSVEMPEIGKLQHERIHGAFFRLLMSLIEKWKAPGIVADVATRNAIEMMAWAAMHRHRDQWLAPQADEADIRQTALVQYAALLKAAMVTVP